MDVMSKELQKLSQLRATHSGFAECHTTHRENQAERPAGTSFQLFVDAENEDVDTGLILQTTLQEFINNLTFQGNHLKMFGKLCEPFGCLIHFCR